MKTKGEEKKKTKKKKKKKKARRKRLCLESNTGPPTIRARAFPLGHVESAPELAAILLLKPSSLIKREFKDIFQKNDCSFDSENPT